jgi:hypothetical protein
MFLDFFVLTFFYFVVGTRDVRTQSTRAQLARVRAQFVPSPVSSTAHDRARARAQSRPCPVYAQSRP